MIVSVTYEEKDFQGENISLSKILLYGNSMQQRPVCDEIICCVKQMEEKPRLRSLDWRLSGTNTLPVELQGEVDVKQNRYRM